MTQGLAELGKTFHCILAEAFATKVNDIVERHTNLLSQNYILYAYTHMSWNSVARKASCGNHVDVFYSASSGDS
ncbi:MAG: hypothetical protein V8S95_13965 [Odoribacter sp.]